MSLNVHETAENASFVIEPSADQRAIEPAAFDPTQDNLWTNARHKKIFYSGIDY
jgi:hypothetical protein